MVERQDVEAALETRRELGAAYQRERSLPARSHHGDPRVLLGSIALGIPVTAVALSNAPGGGGVVVAIIAWIAIVLANIAYSQRR